MAPFKKFTHLAKSHSPLHSVPRDGPISLITLFNASTVVKSSNFSLKPIVGLVVPGHHRPNPPLNSDPACIAFRSFSSSRFLGSVQRLGAGGARLASFVRPPMTTANLPTQFNDSGREFRLGIWFGLSHFALFLVSAILAQQGQGWTGVVIWPIWFVIDFPWSAISLVLFQPSIIPWLQEVRSHGVLLDYVLYPPHLVHGFVGTIWWAFLPNIYFRFKRRHKTGTPGRPNP